MRRFAIPLSILKKHRALLAGGFACVLVTQACHMAKPQLFKRVVDALGTQGGPAMDVVRQCAVILAALFVVRGVSQLLMRWWIVGTSRRLDFELRERIFAHLTRLHFGWYDAARTGDVLGRVTADVEAVRMAVGPGLMYLANTAVAVPVALAFMFSTSPKLALLVLVPLVLVAVATKFLSPRLHAASLAMQEAQAGLANRAQESFAGVRVVKSYGREEGEEEAFARAGDDYRKAVMGLVRIRCFFNPVFWICEGFGLLLILWVGGGEVGRGAMTLGDFTAFLGYNLLLTWPMIALGWVISLLQRGAAAMDRILEVLDTVPAVADPAAPVPLPPEGRGEVEIRDLSFAYGSGPRVLDGISVRVPAGASLGIVGPTGSGKSTLLSLLARLFPVPEGTILLDGTDIGRLRVRDLRRALAFVPQETFLFSLTVRGNIEYGFDGDPGPGVAERAAGAARIEGEIARLPQGYETLLGERGVNLSGGQKQRAAIARALALDPRVLVLDDCLSAVDADTEEAILGNLRERTRGRTTILVSHRVAAVSHADEIVFLEGGRIVERGTHEELLARGGRYATLARLQRIEGELAAPASGAGS